VVAGVYKKRDKMVQVFFRKTELGINLAFKIKIAQRRKSIAKVAWKEIQLLP
jgi:hypothetical protein